MGASIKIAIAEASFILRSGVILVLEQLNIVRIDILEIDDPEQLKTVLARQSPDILIVNPSFLGMYSVQLFRKEFPHLKCVALLLSLADVHLMGTYDETISIYDGYEIIKEKLTQLLVHYKETEKQHEPLSSREKDVLLYVIHGLTNKQIAEKLCLSSHTVMTHRRNISAKLQIHSTAGLAIYAIANKLVTLDNVQ